MQFSNSTVPADSINALLLAGAMPGAAATQGATPVASPGVAAPAFDALFAELAPSTATPGLGEGPAAVGAETPFVQPDAKNGAQGVVGGVDTLVSVGGGLAGFAAPLRWTAAHRVQTSSDRISAGVETAASAIPNDSGSGAATTEAVDTGDSSPVESEAGENDAADALATVRTAPTTPTVDAVVAGEVAAAGIPIAMAPENRVVPDEQADHPCDAEGRKLRPGGKSDFAPAAPSISPRRNAFSSEAWAPRAPNAADCDGVTGAQPEQTPSPRSIDFPAARVADATVARSDPSPSAAAPVPWADEPAQIPTKPLAAVVATETSFSEEPSVDSERPPTSAIAELAGTATSEDHVAGESSARAVPRQAKHEIDLESSRPLSAPSSVEANFADSDEQASPDRDPCREPSDKSFLASSDERLTARGRSLGIDVAKPAATMSARFAATTNAHPSHPVFQYTVDAAPVEAASIAQAAASGATSGTEQIATAHRAVETVLHAIDQFSSRDQKVVELQFSVGDADLKVRVELHANEVRTTFRTDSSELRAALSHEWQSVTVGNPERAVKLAPAVFAGSEASSGNAFAGDASSRQREQGGHGRDAQTAPFSASPSRRGVSAASSGPEAPAARPGRSISAGSLHLHTFA